MRKSEEVSNPNSCLNKAADDAFMFVIYDKDPEMAATIEWWCRRRVEMGVNKWTDAKILSALKLAQDVRDKQAARKE